MVLPPPASVAARVPAIMIGPSRPPRHQEVIAGGDLRGRVPADQEHSDQVGDDDAYDYRICGERAGHGEGSGKPPRP